jgi:Putative beta-barrel porin-2, OmpL-like. bbp2
VSEKVSIGARYELFDNSDGIRALLTKDGDGTKVNSFTLTASIAASPNLIFKPEFRLDAYPSKTQFEDSKGNFTKSSQSTIGIAAIFKY